MPVGRGRCTNFGSLTILAAMSAVIFSARRGKQRPDVALRMSCAVLRRQMLLDELAHVGKRGERHHLAHSAVAVDSFSWRSGIGDAP
jgi:hypothetical protein